MLLTRWRPGRTLPWSRGIVPRPPGRLGASEGRAAAWTLQTGRGVESYTDLTCCPDAPSSAERGSSGGVGLLDISPRHGDQPPPMSQLHPCRSERAMGAGRPEMGRGSQF